MASPTSLLSRLEATRLSFGPGWPEKKLFFLRQLRKSTLTTSAQVLRLHEHACFMRANPDNAEVLAEIERLLAGFYRRADLRDQRERLVDSGIAGTDIHYPFFWPTARWLAARWPAQLAIDWDVVDDATPLSQALAILIPPLEAIWIRTLKPSPQKALARLVGKGTDATFVVRAVESMPGNDFTREAFYESMGLQLIVRAGRVTPSRTMAHYPKVPVHYRHRPPADARPDLWAEIKKPPRSVRIVSPQEGALLIDLARGAMVTRARDLDTFAYGDPDDVRVIDDGEGLSWVMIGLVPERRPVLRTAYGYLTLRNGVPIGYVQSDVLWECVDLAFNIFETFRGREAAFVLGRTMAMLRELFGASSFTLEPYQLGDGNDEGIDSGAWWFYYKLGFRPRRPTIRSLVRTELERMARQPNHRSRSKVLAELAKDYLYLDRPGARAPNWPRLAALGARVAEARSNHGLGDTKTAAADWDSIVALLPGVDQWTDEERFDLGEIIRAKGGRRDIDYLRLFDRHPKLGATLRRLARA